jgi:hypothetical protein
MDDIKNRQHYKILIDGKSPNGSGYEWSLPSEDQPGEWHEFDGELIANVSGFQIISDIYHGSFEKHLQIFPVEVDWDAGYEPGISDTCVVRRLRLLPSPEVIIVGNVKIYTKDGKLHRDGDQPAVILSKRHQRWYKNGLKHRDGDQPAEILPDGTKKYWQNDELHRDGDKPRKWYSNMV